MRKVALSKPKVAIFSAILLVALSIFTVAKQSNFYDLFNAVNKDTTSTAVKTNDNNTTKETPTTTNDTKVASPTNNSATKDSGTSLQNTSTNYTYKAVAGDSYTLFARDAISQYINKNSLSLTDDQKLEAEVAVTNEAGAPELEIGQEVTIENSKIANTINAIAPQSSNHTDTTSSSTNGSQTSSTGNFTKIAKAGDCYALLSREAISNYISANKINLDNSQKIAAETYIMSQAGFPAINAGEQVTIETTAIKTAVDTATNLNDIEKSTWSAWANQAVF